MDKPIVWKGSSFVDLCEFPESARRRAGYELRRLQLGEPPQHWRPFPQAGSGTAEIRIDCKDGWFRVMYVAKFEEAIYVLHSFSKKSRQTSKTDVVIAASRYRSVIAERESGI